MLAEALAEAGDEHGELLGVRLAHLVPPVVPPRIVQVGGAPLHLAARAAARRAPPRGHRVRGAGGAATAHGGCRSRVLVLLRMRRRQRPVGLAGRRGGGPRWPESGEVAAAADFPRRRRRDAGPGGGSREKLGFRKKNIRKIPKLFITGKEKK